MHSDWVAHERYLRLWEYEWAKCCAPFYLPMAAGKNGLRERMELCRGRLIMWMPYVCTINGDSVLEVSGTPTVLVQFSTILIL